jgi:hypothetical protein
MEVSMPEKTLEELVDASTVIFVGTIRTIGASMMPEIPASDEIAVVTVDSVLASAPVLGDLKGTALTIHVNEAGGLNVGDQAVFFTNVWIYGAQLALAEVGRVDAKQESEVATAMASGPDRELAGRLEKADSVVAGIVDKVSDADVVEPISEHAPEWKRATLRGEALKGDHAGSHVDVLFPGSDEPMFETAPKLRPGQEGVFLLHRGEGPFAPPDALTILDQRDVHPPTAHSQIRRLLESRKNQ